MHHFLLAFSCYGHLYAYVTLAFLVIVFYSLKDIEGGEWEVFPLLYSMQEDQLPQQISVEVHLVTTTPRLQILHDLLEHILKMHSLGYALLAREINLSCSECCEMTWIRQQTPKIM